MDEAASAERNIFAASADGNIVEVQRSQRAKDWRRDIRVPQRELPSSYARGANGYSQYNDYASNDLEDDKSIVLWRAFGL